MKVVVSLPKQLVDGAEAIAKGLGMGRDELFEKAISDFLVPVCE